MATVNFDGIYVLTTQSIENPYACCNSNRIKLPESLAGFDLDTAILPAYPDIDIPGERVNILDVAGGATYMRPWFRNFPTNQPLSNYSIVLEVKLGEQIDIFAPIACSLVSSLVNGQHLATLSRAVVSSLNLTKIPVGGNR